jgi:hypothetical protein|nr:hypothetical protein [uncultured Acetatifactor sp.]
MKQKILVTILVFTSMLALSACGSGSGSSSTAAPAPVTDEGSSEVDSMKLAEGFPQDEEAVEGTYTEDELAESTADDSNIANSNGRPYFELGFSPEDFTFAGYSLADGAHYEEAFQVVSENYRAKYENGVGVTYNDEGLVITCDNRGITADPDFTGWTYWNPYWNLADAIYMQYTVNGTGTANGVQYTPRSSTEISLSISADSDNILQEYPFIGAPVMVGMDYDDVIAILQLKELIDYTMAEGTLNETGYYYYISFESQYGATMCYYSPIDKSDTHRDAHINIFPFPDNDKQFQFWLGFRDNILDSVSYNVWEERG